jgi:hypothetical protein
MRHGSLNRHLWKLLIAGYWLVILAVTFLRIKHGGG